MTDKQNFEIKETLTYGHKLLIGKQTKYEFVKQDFEKDIDVPSKQKIMYDYNAKDCEQCSSDSVCCYCKNLTYYKLEEKLKQAEHKLAKIKEYCKPRVMLNGTAYVILQIIEGKENG